MSIQDLTWNAPACEVGEFGVRQIKLEGRPLEPFDAPGLHRTGMVFEPVGSAAEALEAARSQFEETVKGKIKLDRTEQLFVRLTSTRLGLVYYPLWVIRYLYHGRSFQVVVDGFNGEVLYGKAPGSVGFRAGVLVGGMAAGAFLAIDVPTALLLSSSSSDDDSPLFLALLIFAFGLFMMFSAFRTFRHGEHYEYHRYGRSGVQTCCPGDRRAARRGEELNDAMRQLENSHEPETSQAHPVAVRALPGARSGPTRRGGLGVRAVRPGPDP